MAESMFEDACYVSLESRQEKLSQVMKWITSDNVLVTAIFGESGVGKQLSYGRSLKKFAKGPSLNM